MGSCNEKELNVNYLCTYAANIKFLNDFAYVYFAKFLKQK